MRFWTNVICANATAPYFSSKLCFFSPESGAVYTQTSIDRESQLSTNGAVILTIRAQEVGGPFEPYVDTEVTILIEVSPVLIFWLGLGQVRSG